MGSFKTANWECNAKTDSTCGELFSQSKISVTPTKKKKKFKIKQARIEQGIKIIKSAVKKQKTIANRKNKETKLDRFESNNKIKIANNKKTKSTKSEIIEFNKIKKAKSSMKRLKQKIDVNSDKKQTNKKQANLANIKIGDKKVAHAFHAQLFPNKRKSSLSLREKMINQLKSSRFRYLNEQLYLNTGLEAKKIFQGDVEAFQAYHEGYKRQVDKWPLNPLDVIIKSVEKMSKHFVIADFGCGEGKLAERVPQTVHSFDLVALNDSVVACDMSRVPLENSSVDVVVFCLSLMGTNLHEYLQEANRVLKIGGLLKIAEVESRFDNANNFVEKLKAFHFKKTWQDLSRDLFYFFDFKKEASIKTDKKKLPMISLNPCLYKKR